MVDVRRLGRVTFSALAMVTAAGLGFGCATVTERPMTSALFMPPASAGVAPVAEEPVDPSMAVVQPVKSVVPPDDATASPKKAMILSPSTPPTFDAVKPLAPLTAPGPTTAPSDAPLATADAPVPTTNAIAPSAEPVATGVYMTVGGVLARVNGTPIYAHTVLALIDKELQARARDLNPDEFRRFAAERIARQTEELVRDEEDFSMAFKSLSADDKTLAEQNSVAFRQQKIKEAGGSAELARRRAAEEGYDFDDQVRQDYRRVVVNIFRQRLIEPQVQVSPQDAREFYAANSAKLYGDKDRLQFRVIEIDPSRMGGKDPKAAAVAKAESIRAKALAGQDFAAMASTENHNEALRSTGGDPGGWLDRGSYRVDAVENALWQLSPGGITPVIQDGDLLYVAKLEDKHVGQTRPFDDPTVQDDLLKRLTQRQMSVLWEQVRMTLVPEADATTPVEDGMNVALEMVMQKYARWTAR